MSSTRSLGALRLTKPELAVFVSGVASMGLEILAGRMIAPQFGSSIYTWGSIIGVFLAALSYGYHRGGKLAAERATNGRMARVFLLTGAYVAGLIFLGDLLLRASAGFPLPSRFASLPAITLLFGPPTFFLGYVSPYAAQLSAKDGVGEASGHVYALGTVGSIVGAFATTYFLVPSLGITQIALVFGLLSVGTALVLVRPRADGDHAVASAFVVLLLLAAAGSGAAGLSVEGRVVYETQTPYQELRVVDSGEVRTLYLDGQRHSAMDLEEPYRHVFDYTRYFHLPLLMTDDVDRVLFVGGGGFTGPKRFVRDYPNVTVDVVEIDPEVVSTAKRYFSVEESERLNVYTRGGRQYLQETNQTYDLIVLDAYRKDKVPFELTTVEFMELANDRLDEDGVLFANLISAPSGPASQFYRAEYKTISRAFPRVYSFPTAGGTVVQNIEVVATKNDARLTEEELLARNAEREIGIDLSSEIRNYREAPPTDDVPLLRDDRAPVDSLLDPMVGQRYVLQESNASNSSDAGNATIGTAADRESLAARSLGPTASAETPWTPAAREAATVGGGFAR
ncbi:spermidine synthase [Halogeometricum pallidum JCM 14848]|uniref:Polyamine aminopropyltransferase n=1 Tax=Halogeometricum pallidum JCM 14848 TaxID=1227487 RepID=M0DF09_HALPD|nr:fused MFS/spermidine synthase [Halogeometricum pallidum]ELZ33327.1 spermidine synthase [Halogeometricum pallidum JCM 14848]